MLCNDAISLEGEEWDGPPNRYIYMRICVYEMHYLALTLHNAERRGTDWDLQNTQHTHASLSDRILCVLPSWAWSLFSTQSSLSRGGGGPKRGVMDYCIHAYCARRRVKETLFLAVNRMHQILGIYTLARESILLFMVAGQVSGDCRMDLYSFAESSLLHSDHIIVPINCEPDCWLLMLGYTHTAFAE